MSAVFATAATTKGSLTVAPHSKDLVMLNVIGEDGALEASGTACAKVIRELCDSLVSALLADEICLARGRGDSIQLRVINGRYSAEVAPRDLRAAVDELLARLGIVL